MDFDNFCNVTTHKVFEITTTCSIDAEEELFANYGKDYGGGFGEWY